MRRFFAMCLVLGAVASASALSAASVGAQPSRDDVRRGLIFAGLNRATDGLCRNAFVLSHRESLGDGLQELCTHGPDPAPPGIDVRQRQAPEPEAAPSTAPGSPGVAESGGTVPCFGDGSDGYRVQLIYARSWFSPDQFGAFSTSFLTWAARMDQVVNDSAAETGGIRHIRFVTDAACTPVVDRVFLSPSGVSDFNGTVSELRNQGYTRSDRKYIVWVDANIYCGIAQVYPDDRSDATPGVNYSNGRSSVPGEIGRIDNGCWGRQYMVEAHELMHTLGGVQPSAPHATPGYHCTDEYDRMCRADGSVSPSAIQYVCPSAHEALYDCNHDDYFSTAPASGSYLDTHWNTANSVFLTSSGPTPTPPPPPVTTTTSTSTTVVPTSTSTTSTTLATTTTTTAVSTTTTVPPPTTTTTTTTTTKPNNSLCSALTQALSGASDPSTRALLQAYSTSSGC